MATNRILQLLRSNTTYTSFDVAKDAVEHLNGHLDGEILLARYGTGTPTGEGQNATATGPFYTAIGVYDAGHTKWTVFKSSDEIEDAIAALQDELDNTQEGAGLGEDGSYTAPVSGEDGYDVIGTAISLNDAINKIAKAIEDMDYSNNYTAASGTEPNVTPAHATDASKVISGISQVDGQVDAVTTDAVDLLLTGYANNDTTNVDSISASDTIETALNKLENQTAAGVQISAQTGNQLHRLTGSGVEGLATKLSITKLSASDINSLSDADKANIRDAYKLVDLNGAVATAGIGDLIKIYKDSSLTDVYLGLTDDTLSVQGSTYNRATDITTGTTGSESLNFVYHLEDGTYSLSAVNVEAFLQESEFGDGLTVTNHVVNVNAGNGLVINGSTNAVDVNPGVGIEISSDAVAVKIDTTSEKDSNSTDFLTVSSTGVKVQGIKDEIDHKIDALDGTATASTVAAGTDTTPTGDFCVLTKVGEENGVVQEVAASGTYASKSVLLKKVAATGAAEDVTIADSGNLITATTVEGALQEIAQNVNNNQVVSNDVIVATPDTTNHNTKLSVTTGNGLTKEGDNSDTLNVALSTQAENATDAAYAGGQNSGNILQIKNDGLYLDSTWDCGTY